MDDNLKSFLQLIKGLPSREEFVKAFGVVTERHKKFEKDTAKALVDFHAKVHKKIDDRLAQIKDGRDGKDGRHGKDGKDGQSIKGEKGDKGESGVRGLDGRDGKHGKDGRDGERGATGASGRPLVGWGAHPLQIQGSGSVKTKVARVVNFTGATVSQSGDGVTTVAISAGGLNPQTPSGTVNGSNVTFTITGSLNALFVNGQFMNPGGVDYTLSGTTITMVTAPPTGSTIYCI